MRLALLCGQILVIFVLANQSVDAQSGALGPGPQVQHIAQVCDDANDGLSWGTAKCSIQSAIDTVPPNTRLVVEIGSGVYMQDEPIRIADRHVVIRGQGMTTTLRTTQPIDLLTFDAESQSIVGAGVENLSVEGFNQGVTGITLERSGPYEVTMFYIENVFVNGFQTQVFVDAPTKMTVTNSAFEFGYGQESAGLRMNSGNAVLISTWFEQTEIGLDLRNDSHVTAIQTIIATNVSEPIRLTGGWGYQPVYEQLDRGGSN